MKKSHVKRVLRGAGLFCANVTQWLMGKIFFLNKPKSVTYYLIGQLSEFFLRQYICFVKRTNPLRTRNPCLQRVPCCSWCSARRPWTPREPRAGSSWSRRRQSVGKPLDPWTCRQWNSQSVKVKEKIQFKCKISDTITKSKYSWLFDLSNSHICGLASRLAW